MSEHVGDQLMEDLRRICHALSERHGIDSIQVFCTWPDSNGQTGGLNYGIGNHYARRGIVASWLEANNEQPCNKMNNNSGNEPA